jgi:hypothetical protein
MEVLFIFIKNYLLDFLFLFHKELLIVSYLFYKELVIEGLMVNKLSLYILYKILFIFIKNYLYKF